MADTRFVGCWEKNPDLTLQNESDTLKASVYVKKDKPWLVVANLGTDSQTATVTLNPANLGATGIDPGMPWKNVFGVGDVSKAGNSVNVNVLAKSLRILELGDESVPGRRIHPHPADLLSNCSPPKRHRPSIDRRRHIESCRIRRRDYAV